MSETLETQLRTKEDELGSNSLFAFLMGQMLPGLTVAVAANWSVSWVDGSSPGTARSLPAWMT